MLKICKQRFVGVLSSLPVYVDDLFGVEFDIANAELIFYLLKIMFRDLEFNFKARKMQTQMAVDELLGFMIDFERQEIFLTNAKNANIILKLNDFMAKRWFSIRDL